MENMKSGRPVVRLSVLVSFAVVCITNEWIKYQQQIHWKSDPVSKLGQKQSKREGKETQVILTWQARSPAHSFLSSLNLTCPYSMFDLHSFCTEVMRFTIINDDQSHSDVSP